MHTFGRCALVLALATPGTAQADPDSDGDGLSDFHEVHKYRTDATKADSDGDGVPDGDWFERREYQYTVRAVVQVMKPVTPEYLCDDHQDARVLDETADHVELEVVLYPFTSVAAAVAGDADWRTTAAAMQYWTAPGPSSDWTPAMRERLERELVEQGIAIDRLDDKGLVEQASRWLCRRAANHDGFTTFVTAWNEHGEPFVPPDLRASVALDDEALRAAWARDVSARGMFEQRTRGSCSSSAIYLSGCLRALGMPTRTILTIPLIDAGDERELRMAERDLTHHRLRRTVLPALKRLRRAWASHTCNEVFVGGRWRRLNYDHLGQDILDGRMFGLSIHVATFRDWADANMPATIGRRQAPGQAHDDVFGGRNPYSTVSLRDAFGPHCTLDNPEPEPVVGRVTQVAWGDGDDAPDYVRAWFAKRGVFGLVARIEGPANGEDFEELLAASDLRVHLTAAGAPDLGVGFAAGAYWWRGDHAWIVVPFGAADRRDHVPGQTYAFGCRNVGGRSSWRVADGVEVPARD